jgi:hypothetical protein
MCEGGISDIMGPIENDKDPKKEVIEEKPIIKPKTPVEDIKGLSSSSKVDLNPILYQRSKPLDTKLTTKKRAATGSGGSAQQNRVSKTKVVQGKRLYQDTIYPEPVKDEVSEEEKDKDEGLKGGRGKWTNRLKIKDTYFRQYPLITNKDEVGEWNKLNDDDKAIYTAITNSMLNPASPQYTAEKWDMYVSQVNYMISTLAKKIYCPKPCFRCLSHGHKTAECNYAAKCLICLELGHVDEDCPTATCNTRTCQQQHKPWSCPSFGCQFCGKKGHDPKKCFKKKQKPLTNPQRGNYRGRGKPQRGKPANRTFRGKYRSK